MSTETPNDRQWEQISQAAQAAADLAARANESNESLWSRLTEVEDLAARIVEQITDTPAGGPWCWRYLDPYETQALFYEVRDWVDWMVVRYQVGSIVLPCWYKHGAAIEELTGLYVAWRATYPQKPRAYSDELTAWHDRWFWPCIRRIQAERFFKGCTRLQHADDKDRTIVTDPDEFARDMRQFLDTVEPGMDAEQIHTLIDQGQGVPLRPEDPTSPVKYGDTWWAILANSPDGKWVPRPPHIGEELDKIQEQQHRPRS